MKRPREYEIVDNDSEINPIDILKICVDEEIATTTPNIEKTATKKRKVIEHEEDDDDDEPHGVDTSITNFCVPPPIRFCAYPSQVSRTKRNIIVPHTKKNQDYEWSQTQGV